MPTKAKTTKADASAAARVLVAARGDRAKGPAADRLLEAKAAREELRLARERGELLPAADVAEAWAQIIGVCRQRLLGLPSKLAPILAGETDPRRCRKILDDEVRAALTELSETEVVARE